MSFPPFIPGMIRKLALGSAAGAGFASALYYVQTQQQQQAPPAETRKRTPRYELPPKVEYLLIGGGASTSGAYRAIRATDPKAQILIVGLEEYLPYMKAPLSKELWQSKFFGTLTAWKAIPLSSVRCCWTASNRLLTSTLISLRRS